MMPNNTHEAAERLTFNMMRGDRFEGIHEARRYMGECWERGDAMIPNCIKPGDVELDLAYTTPETAKFCVDDLMQVIPDGMRFIEPSAGTGAFLKHLPSDTIAMDVLPKHPDVKLGEFLTYEPPGPGPYCVVGAPPFSDNLWLTNAFTVHALDMAEWACFITDPKAVLDVPNGNIHHAVPLGPDAMRNLSGGRVRRKLEWRVWYHTADQKVDE